jgi:valyl-tRNA synthetase
LENLSTKFNPNEVEKGKYEHWVESGVFKPNGDKNAKP